MNVSDESDERREEEVEEDDAFIEDDDDDEESVALPLEFSMKSHSDMSHHFKGQSLASSDEYASEMLGRSHMPILCPHGGTSKTPEIQVRQGDSEKSEADPIFLKPPR